MTCRLLDLKKNWLDVRTMLHVHGWLTVSLTHVARLMQQKTLHLKSRFSRARAMLRRVAGRACTLALSSAGCRSSTLEGLSPSASLLINHLSGSDDQPSTSTSSASCWGAGYSHLPAASISHVRHASSDTGSWWWGRFAPKSLTQGSESGSTDALLDAGTASNFPLPETSTEAVMAITQALDAADRAVIVAAKNDAFFLLSYLMDAMQYMHEQCGLPW